MRSQALERSLWREATIPSKKLLQQNPAIIRIMSNQKYHRATMLDQFIVANTTNRRLPVAAAGPDTARRPSLV
ncbi:hypothetical protein [Burkholderia territorii]|uniref:hypothetical protein n=1 Tax=Burkholderia territorii TaxID=1503055 RepID=UPI0012D9EA8E|nr:hypothetical protein [Burkholderia territorii]